MARPFFCPDFLRTIATAIAVSLSTYRSPRLLSRFLLSAIVDLPQSLTILTVGQDVPAIALHVQCLSLDWGWFLLEPHTATVGDDVLQVQMTQPGSSILLACVQEDIPVPVILTPPDQEVQRLPGRFASLRTRCCRTGGSSMCSQNSGGVPDGLRGNCGVFHDALQTRTTHPFPPARTLL